MLESKRLKKGLGGQITVPDLVGTHETPSRSVPAQMRLVTNGHGVFNTLLYLGIITDSPLCWVCVEAEEMAAHVLLKCPGTDGNQTWNDW